MQLLYLYVYIYHTHHTSIPHNRSIYLGKRSRLRPRGDHHNGLSLSTVGGGVVVVTVMEWRADDCALYSRLRNVNTKCPLVRIAGTKFGEMHLERMN